MSTLPSPVSYGEQLRQARNLSQHLTMTNLLRAGLAAGAAGAGYRGLLGIKDMYAKDKLLDLASSPTQPAIIRMPRKRPQIMPEAQTEEDDAKLDEKAAAEAPSRDILNQSPIGNIAGKLVDSLGLTRRPGQQPGILSGYLSGWNATNPWDKVWAVGAAPLLVGGGLAAGYKGTDLLLDKARANEVNTELEAAKSEYEKALYGDDEKKASGEPGSRDMLNAVWNTLQEKQALLGTLGGAYLAAMLGAAGLAGGATYSYGRARNRADLMQKALKRRAELYAQHSPAPIVVMPNDPAEEEQKQKQMAPV